MRSLSLFFLAFSSMPAFAQGAPMSCWGAVGWQTPTGSNVEQAILIPTPCHTTVSNQFYVPVQQLFAPLPETLWLKVLSTDPHITNGEFFMTPVYVGDDVDGDPIIELEFFYGHDNLWPLQNDPPDPCGAEVSFFDGTSAPGTWDNANCHVEQVPAGASGFIYDNNYYLQPEPGIVCDLGTSDGENCGIGPMPAGQTTYKSGGYVLVTRPSGAACAYGTPVGTNLCNLGLVPDFVDPFVFNGLLYVKSRRDCVDGRWDGANCYVGTPPAGHSAFLWPDSQGSFYYAL